MLNADYRKEGRRKGTKGRKGKKKEKRKMKSKKDTQLHFEGTFFLVV